MLTPIDARVYSHLSTRRLLASSMLFGMARQGERWSERFLPRDTHQAYIRLCG